MNSNNNPEPKHEQDKDISSHGSTVPEPPPAYSNLPEEDPRDVLPCASMGPQPPFGVQPVNRDYPFRSSAAPLPPPQYQVQPYQPFFSNGQQATVITTNGQPAVVESFAGQMLYSCFVAWCCNLVFGVMGFALAIAASNRAVSDSVSARKLGKASYAVSTTGLILTLTIVGIVIRIYSTTTYTIR